MQRRKLLPLRLSVDEYTNNTISFFFIVSSIADGLCEAQVHCSGMCICVCRGKNFVTACARRGYEDLTAEVALGSHSSLGMVLYTFRNTKDRTLKFQL
jgi:hypothetical protein